MSNPEAMKHNEGFAASEPTDIQDSVEIWFVDSFGAAANLSCDPNIEIDLEPMTTEDDHFNTKNSGWYPVADIDEVWGNFKL